MRVLIADDEPGTRLVVSAAVAGLGHEVIGATDGAHAWERVRELRPDLVITDWDMPGLDGTELVRRVRADAHAPYAYVLVLSGMVDETAARAVMEAGADDLMVKPLDPAELERTLIAAARVTGLHRRLHADARQDALTGVGNRLRLDEDLASLCGRVERYGHSYCVAMFDVDHFKAYNDAHGHPAGDDVLRAVAGALAGSVRAGDRLLDVGMPGGGGNRAAAEIREALPHVRVVAISGDDSQLNQYDMLRAGAVGFLAKGAPDEAILRVIRSAARW